VSILAIDSFDGYTSAEIPNFWIDCAISASASIGTPARTGSGAMQPRPGGVARNVGTNLMAAIIAAAFTTQASAGPIFQFTQSGIHGTIQCSLNFAANGCLYITYAGGNAFAATTDLIPPASPGIYNYIEWLTGFTHFAHNIIRVNGHVVFDGVLDCQSTIGAGADCYFLLGPGGSNYNLFDDFCIINPNDGTGQTTFTGDAQVICGIPSSDGDQGWNTHPTNPNHYQNVKEIPCDFNTTYNFSIGSGQDDTYFVAPQLPLHDDIVYLVQLTEIIADQDGDGQRARVFLEINGVFYFNPLEAIAVGSGYIPAQIVRGFPTNPLTSSPWTQTQVNETSWGIQQV
jgi:hypothetical protein